jgi:ribonuclease HII
MRAEPLGRPYSSTRLAGVDEAGRGPLAGPVVAAAVVFPAGDTLDGVRDSKKLTRKKREYLDQAIKDRAVCWAIGEADVTEIDSLNILQATLLAMSRAVGALPVLPELVLVDGCHAPDLTCRVRTVVNGDQVVPSISAASILAKVYRDKIMTGFHHFFPEYGFATNMGYPTRSHLAALARYGPTAIHRRSFAPVRAVVHDFKRDGKR